MELPKIKPKALNQSFITATTLLLIDLFFHVLFSSPQETTTYYGIKFIIAALIAYTYFSFPIKPTALKNAITSIIFALVFSVWYRLTEVAYKIGFLGRVPDLHFFGQVINIYSSPLTSITLWTLIHGGGFFMGTLIAERMVKK